MKHIKDITISIFAIIGFFTVLTGYSSGTFENEVGTYQLSASVGGVYKMNTKTGYIVQVTDRAIKKSHLNE
jgi:hypothetical protein